MATMTIKGTTITVTCENAEDLFQAWHALSLYTVCIVNGEELKAREVNHFCGYTREFFEKYFK